LPPTPNAPKSEPIENRKTVALVNLPESA
jgi:hypothetical protein